MVTKTLDNLETGLLDKEAARAWIEKLNASMGLVRDPSVTPEMVRDLMLADGIRPEDNIASREIIKIRDGEEE